MPAHIKCLRMWLKKKCNKSENKSVIYYDYSLLNCDICKKKFPQKIEVDGRKENLI